jgi:hypothetical protein
MLVRFFKSDKRKEIVTVFIDLIPQNIPKS